MEKALSVHKVQTPLRNSVVTIGNFDGVHIGHREIIAKVVKRARETDGVAIVMTFHPHPRKVLFPEADLKNIFPNEDQQMQFENLGVDVWVQEPFSRDLSQLSAEAFLRDWILKPLSVKSLIVGYDFAFGANREGSLSLLELLCQRYGIHLEVVPAIKISDRIVSSTEVRKSVQTGEMEFVKSMLGRYFFITGIVEKGDQRGRTIGFPTANVSTAFETLPQTGVYATQTKIRGQVYDSVTNVGVQPTIEKKDSSLKIESHILEFNKDIYGEEITIFFHQRIRSEKKFKNLQELSEQIRVDVEEAKRILTHARPSL